MTHYAAEHNGPVYIRLDSYKADDIHSPDYKFTPGEAIVIREGSDLSIITLGTIVHDALKAADRLAEKGISAEIISLPSIRPLNPAGIIASIRKTGAALTVEEHSTHGGIGTITGEIILDNRLGCRFNRLGVPAGSFAEAAPRDTLKQMYGLDVDGIYDTAMAMLKD